MNIQLTLAARYLSGRKLRTLLTSLAIVFGVSVIFGLNSIIPTIMEAFQANMMAAVGQVDTTITLKTYDAFDAGAYQTVSEVEGVRAASGYINRTINLPPDYYDQDAAAPDKVTTLSLVGIDPDQATALHVYIMQSGRFLEPADQEAVLISESLADMLGLQIGDELPLPVVQGEVHLKIIGLLPPRLQPGNEEVLVTLPQAQAMLNLPGKINTIEANYKVVNEHERAALDAEILARLGDAFQLGTLETNSELLSNLGLAQIILNMIGILALLMGGFIIFNTFRTLVAERRRDIGMLRVLGATRRNIMDIILVEGLVQGILGTGFGIVFGYLLAISMVKAVNPIMRQFLNIALPNPEVTPVALFGSIAMGIGITLLAGLLPARQASKITPLEALRPQLGQVKLKQMTGSGFWSGVVMIVLAVAALLTRNSGLVAVGGVLFIVGLILAAPALVQPISNLFGSLLSLIFARSGVAHLAQGNITRQPSRSIITASTTMIGMAILVMAAAMVTSLTGGFENVIRKNLGSDFLLIPPSVALWGADVGADRSLIEEISRTPGVAVVSSLRYAPSQLEGTAISVMGIDPVTYPQVSGLDFSKGDEQEAYAALNQGRSIIVNGVMAATFGVKVGDDIALMTSTGAQTYHVAAIGGDYFNVKIATGYISQANMAADFQRSDNVMVQINLAADADAQAVETALRDVVKDYPQFRLVDGRGYIDETMGLFNAAFAGMTLLVIFLSIPSLIAMINTLAIGVIERTQEIGMLRAVGTTRRQIQRMITAESLILAGLGTALGILAGLYLGYLVVKAMQGFGFPLLFSPPVAGVLLALAGGIVLGLVAAIIPARQAARMVIVEALRYE